MTTSKLIAPLANLINKPRDFKDIYIPVMPQDSIFDVQNAIRDASRGRENPQFYACPNGHLYVLFDCGRPWVVTKCNTAGCNADIGGTSHNLLPGNKKIDVNDTSLKGYCLPDAGMLSDEPSTDRQLSSYAFHTIRFIIHSCLYFACEHHESDVTYIMAHALLPDKKKFFWDHLNKDLRILCKTLNLNMDEVIILLHLVCNKLMLTNTHEIKWNSKADRTKWENQFQQIIDPIFKNSSDELKKSLDILKETDSKGDNQSQQMYFMAYELLDDNDKDKHTHVYDDVLLWKYKPQVNLTILTTEMSNQTKHEDFQLLKKFVDMESRIRVLRNLPDIAKFINFLKGFYFKNLFKHYASNMTLKQIMMKKTFPKCKLITANSRHNETKIYLRAHKFMTV